MQDQDFTPISLPKMTGYAAIRDYLAGGWEYSAWREGQGRFFVELRGDRIFRFAAPALAMAEEALLSALDSAA